MRISVSHLQVYQRYRDTEEITLEQCLAELKGEREETEAMRAGKILHALLENADYDTEEMWVERDGMKFCFACDVDLAVPLVRELKGQMEFNTPSGPVTLVGVVDAIDTSIGDYKLSARFDAERLADSWQWRCYLRMFNCHKFVYRVFVGEEIKPNEWIVRDYHELPLYRYPGMDEEIQKEIEECAAFLSKYLYGQIAA